MAASSNLARGTIAGADVIRRIKAFNRGRDPKLLARKYAAMRSGAFAFYRGTCHLFYEDWPRRSPLNGAPLAWVSGDLHPENFGSYRGRDGVVYFDVNDFDEAVLGNCLWDVARCLTGIAIGSVEIGILAEDADALARRFVYAYATNLGRAPAAVDADTSRGMVHELLQGVRKRSAARLVKERTRHKKRKRRILLDDVHATALSAADRAYAEKLFDRWTATLKKRSRFALEDVAERLAGTGSMGVARFIVLASCRRKTLLFDVKSELPPSARPALRAAQPRWESDAQRVVELQERCQAVAPSPLRAFRDGRGSYVIKVLEPTADRVHWDGWHGRLDRLEHLCATLGIVTARSHTRGAGKHGAARTRELARFAADATWPAHVMQYARSYASKVRADHARFCRAYDAGEFG